MTAPLTVDDLLEGIPRDQLAARIASDIHLSDIAKKVTKWSEIVPYLGLGEVEEEDIEVDHRTGPQKRFVLS